MWSRPPWPWPQASDPPPQHPLLVNRWRWKLVQAEGGAPGGHKGHLRGRGAILDLLLCGGVGNGVIDVCQVPYTMSEFLQKRPTEDTSRSTHLWIVTPWSEIQTRLWINSFWKLDNLDLGRRINLASSVDKLFGYIPINKFLSNRNWRFAFRMARVKLVVAEALFFLHLNTTQSQ